MSKWLKKHFSYNTKKIFDEICWKHLLSCERVLDVACGNGSFIKYHPEQAEGIDLSEEAVQYCQARGWKVCQADATDLPYPAACFEGVHCAHLIEHYYPEEAWQLLVELDRVLAPKGILCLRAPLAHRNFYDDLSHIRPYPPAAVMEYLVRGFCEDQPRSFAPIEGKYEMIGLRWRHFPLFCGRVRNGLIKRVLEAMARYGLRSVSPSGYLLILKKVS